MAGSSPIYATIFKSSFQSVSVWKRIILQLLQSQYAIGLTLLLAFVSGVAHAETPYSVNVTRDAQYGVGTVRDDAGNASRQPLLLDVYAPANCADRNKPALILVHGGGFRNGDKGDKNMAHFAQYFAARGFVCFSINYRMQRDNPPDNGVIPGEDRARAAAIHAAFVDAKTAVRWVRANATVFGVDSNRIAALGGSAGAITVLAVAYTGEDTFLTDVPGRRVARENHPGVSSRINACASCWGSAAMFSDDVDRSDPPVLLFHGEDDKNVNTPPAASEFVRDKCKAAGVPVELHMLPGFGHGAWAAKVDDKTLVEVTWDFMQRNLVHGK